MNLKVRCWGAKFIRLGVVVGVLALGACSTHFYGFDEDKVTLYLRNSQTESMVFACSLDGYESRQLKQHNGLWEISLPSDSSFRYFYIVDGEIFLPPCPLKEKDDFGAENCIFEPKL